MAIRMHATITQCGTSQYSPLMWAAKSHEFRNELCHVATHPVIREYPDVLPCMSKTQRSFVCTGFAAGGRQTPLVGYVNPAMARELQTLPFCEFPEHVSRFRSSILVAGTSRNASTVRMSCKIEF